MSGQRALDHVFLTRFNLPSEGVESLIRAREDWLRQRVELFQRYTIPSVAAQTSRNFRWLVYFDPESPDWLRRLIDGWEASGAFVPLYRATVGAADLVADLRSVVGEPGRELLTTNLDNDDGLAADFVERLQAVSTGRPRAAVYVRWGLIRSPHGLYLRSDPVNAFCSVRETWDEPGTCWVDWHNMLGRHMSVVELDGEPGWLQVIHGTNVSNRVRGRLVSPTRYRRTYAGLVDDVEPPSWHERIVDTTVGRPWRGIREGGRAAAKGAIMAAGGKRALDWVKLMRRRLAFRAQ